MSESSSSVCKLIPWGPKVVSFLYFLVVVRQLQKILQVAGL